MAIAHVQHDLYDVAADGTLSFNVTHPGGSNVLLVVTLAWNKSWADSLDSELYAAGSGTFIGEHHVTNTKIIRQTVWPNPTAGTNAIAFSASSGNANTAIVAIADWFTGVDQTTPVVGPNTFDPLSGAWTTPSHTALTAGSDERLFMSTVSDNAGLTWPAGGTSVTVLTSRGHDTGGSACSANSGYTTLDGYDTIEYTSAILANWASMAFVINAVVAGPVTYVPGPYNLRRRGRMAA